MLIIQVGFLVAGIVFLVASFFISEKLSSSDLEEIRKISEKEINVIIEKQLQRAENEITKSLEDKSSEASDRLEVRTDRMTNEKIMSIEEYSTTVLNSIDESQKQAMFMYNMLVEKQDKLTDMTKDVHNLESNLIAIRDGLEKDYGKKAVKVNEEVDLDMELTRATTNEPSIEEALEKEIAPTTDSLKEKIIRMYNEGETEVDIAKKLGKGLGEIKLILGLFREEN